MKKEDLWKIAIGLQDVDNLKVSDYLIELSKDHIAGLLDIQEVRERINKYYNGITIENRQEEADKVSIGIVEILMEDDFDLSPLQLNKIHKILFNGLYKEAGKYRNYNITKEEKILDNDTVVYTSFENIKDTLDYDFNEERKTSYKNYSIDKFINHISIFISNIWQVHPFCEGNTRTISVFLIKYLRYLHHDINPSLFENKSHLFRDSLVKSNYSNYQKNIVSDNSVLKNFFYNLLTDSNYDLN